MNAPVLQCILGFILLTVEGTTGCRKELFSERLGRYPDSWRILRNTSDQYLLAFYSIDPKLGSNQMCLRTISRRLDETKPWMSKLVYGHTWDNKTLRSGTVDVGITKTNESLVFDDAFNTTYKEPVPKQEFVFEDKHDISQIIYTNFRNCIVMYSKLLGYQVWVKEESSTAIVKIPYLCTFLYEACAGRRKHWAYDWKICPKIRPKESSNSGHTRKPRSIQ
uniref:Putative salivary lipocalin n=1 Tax=Ixodes ricinus TaxID=34613 RepID=A0A0K8R4K8_IXORI